MLTPIQLIVGLRNPGAKYSRTRHNAGGWFAEALARRYEALFKLDKKFHGELASLEINGFSCRVLLPLTYMNHSGMPVRAVSQFYRIHAHEILIVHDDLDFSVGRIKLKTGGGHGGHNGLRDVINQLGSRDFHRLRVGIGHPGHQELVLNYVLGKPTQQERLQILEAIDRGIAAMPSILAGHMASAMNLLNV